MRAIEEDDEDKIKVKRRPLGLNPLLWPARYLSSISRTRSRLQKTAARPTRRRVEREEAEDGKMDSSRSTGYERRAFARTQIGERFGDCSSADSIPIRLLEAASGERIARARVCPSYNATTRSGHPAEPNARIRFEIGARSRNDSSILLSSNKRARFCPRSHRARNSAS